MTDAASHDSYSAAFQGGIPESEQQRLDLQGELFAPLAAWTFDALGIGPGSQVLEIGCGGGGLLAEAAARVGPSGRVVGVDREPALLAAARERVAAYPWAEVVAADALAYDPSGARFDAVHCRFVLMHQPDPDASVVGAPPRSMRTDPPLRATDQVSAPVPPAIGRLPTRQGLRTHTMPATSP